jgi:hypothetical protein
MKNMTRERTSGGVAVEIATGRIELALPATGKQRSRLLSCTGLKRAKRVFSQLRGRVGFENLRIDGRTVRWGD